MPDKQLTNLFLEQSNDLIWIIDSNFCLVYANKAYLNLMKEVTGEEKKLNEPVLIEGFGDGYIEKWKAYYERGLNGEQFEIEENFDNPNTNQLEYSQISFKPITDESQGAVYVGCQSRDITSFKKSNTEAEKLLDASSDVICQIDEQGIFTKVSAACKDLWGYEKHELIGKAYIDFVIKEDVEKTNEVAADIIAGKRITTFENRYKRKDGGLAFNIWSAKYDPKNQIMFCVARDAKEKIRKEELLIESENRFKALVQEGADMISIVDTAGTYMYTSPTTTAILGITPEEFDGHTVFDFIHPDDIERAAGYMLRISTENMVIVEPFRLRNGKNEWRWIETVLTNMLDNPAVNGIVANSRDITEKVNMLKDKEANDQLFKTVIESSPDCLKIINNEGLIVYMNFIGLCQMEIDDFSEFKDKQWSLLWGPENEKLISESVYKAFTGETVEFIAFCPTVKGTPKWWDIKVSPVIKEGEPIEKIIAVSRDITVQKEEEQRLKLLESVVTNTNDAVVITEAEPFNEPGPRILYVNEAFTRMTGYTPQEVIGKTPRILQGPKSDKEALAKLSKALRNFEPHEITTINYKKNGDEFWVNFSVSPVVDQSGWCTHWIAIERDVTENKQQEEKLIKAKELAEENEQKMKQAQKLAHIGSWYYDVVNQVSQWSEETYNIWGLNQDITSVDFVDHQKLIHPKDWERFNSVIKNALEKGIPYQMDLELVRPDGSYKTVNTIGDPIFDENNKVIAFKGTTQDISDRIIIENELRSAIKKAEESDARFKAYTQQSPIAIYTTDINGDCIYANETWLKMAAMQLEDALGKGWINALHPEDLEYVTDNWYKSIESNGEWNYEYRFVNSNKNIIWVNGSAKKLFNDKNELIGYLGSNVNITERKKAEQEKNSLLTTLEKSLNEIYVFDAETLKFSYVNQGALNNIGYSEQEIKELTPLDLKPEFTATTFNQLVNPLVTKEKEKIVFFSNHKRKNGSLYPVEIHLQLVTEDNNKRFLAVILDITNLKETEQLLDSASKLARVGSWEILLQDNAEFKVFWSIMTKNILEIDELFEPTIANGINFYKEPSRSLMEAAVNNAIETGEAFDLELELVSGKGNDIWIRCIGDAQFENGKVTRIYGSFQDINTRKVAELNQLKLNEEKSTILESIGDAFYALDDELNFTYMNSSCANLLAVDKEKIIGKNLFTEYPELKNTLFEDELIKVLNTAEAKKFEFYFSPFDTWFDESIYPTPTGISVYFVDITERKKANAAIAKSEDKRRLIMNGALDAIITIDTNETISFWNPQAEVVFGWKAEEVMGKPLSEVIIPEAFRKYHVEGLKHYLKTGEGKALNVLLELSAIKRNREEFPIELTVLPIKQGGEEFFCAFIRDITQRKNYESKLIENENYLRTILDNEPECVKVLNSKGELLSINPAGLAMIEADNEQQVLGHRMMDLVNKEYQLGFNRLSKEVFKGNAGSFEFEITGLKGGCRWLETHAVPLKDPTGKIVNLLGVTRDITKRKQSEIELLDINKKLNIQTKELQRSNEELEQFAFIASHDLQEPLRMISSFMGLLKHKYADRLDEKGLQYIHFATDGAKRMKQIILDLLLFSKTNRPTEQNELIDLNEIVAEYTQLRRKVIAEKSATITFQGLPSIETYRAPITQIFHCLLDNALKYVDENQSPSIEIGAIEKENVWQFSIKDNGIGIDPKFYDKIFIIFQRLQNRKEDDGTGIGLAITKRSVEFLGGEIWVESEKDKGSTFYFTILKINQLI